jgi:hypothetical protein
LPLPESLLLSPSGPRCGDVMGLPLFWPRVSKERLLSERDAQRGSEVALGPVQSTDVPVPVVVPLRSAAATGPVSKARPTAVVRINVFIEIPLRIADCMAAICCQGAPRLRRTR